MTNNLYTKYKAYNHSPEEAETEEPLEFSDHFM